MTREQVGFCALLLAGWLLLRKPAALAPDRGARIRNEAALAPVANVVSPLSAGVSIPAGEMMGSFWDMAA